MVAKLSEANSRSHAMNQILKTARVVAFSDVSILITGETGSGKEVVAQFIHEYSSRNKSPLVTINCAAIPDAMFESELFGHVKGAFTGAVNDKVASLEATGSGTLFLDEIGEISFSLQAKLLRVVQSGDYRKVGSTKLQHFTDRLIAASNIDLTDKSVFRADLFYRIAVVRLHVPPLRERKSDMPYLIISLAKRHGFKLSNLAEEAMEVLAKYDCPGNIRQLENVILYFTIFSSVGPDYILLFAMLCQQRC